MKVIEKGREQTGWAKELLCSGHGNKGGGCSALLLVEKDDVFKTHMDEGAYDTFACSECGVWTDLAIEIPFDPPFRAEWLARAVTAPPEPQEPTGDLSVTQLYHQAIARAGTFAPSVTYQRPRWAHVAEVFGVSPTEARALCCDARLDYEESLPESLPPLNDREDEVKLPEGYAMWAWDVNDDRWLVTLRNGEPHRAVRPERRDICPAHRDSFVRWAALGYSGA